MRAKSSSESFFTWHNVAWPNIIWAFRFSILSGFLIGTSYIPFPPWALFFCLSPLFIFWRTTESARRAFWGGWLTQFILNMIGFHWIAYTAVEFGHFPLWFGLVVLVAFCALAHLHYPLAGIISFHLQRKFRLTDGPAFLAMVIVFGLLEALVPMIFPWHLGYPWLWAHLPGAQLADIIGFEGLNTLTVLANAGFAWAFLSWRKTRHEQNSGGGLKSNRPIWIAGITIAGLIALNLAGLGRAEKWDQGDAHGNFVIVQGNIGNFDKIIAERGKAYRDPIIQKYISLTKAALEKHPDADVVMWPETAFPGVLDSAFHYEEHPKILLDYVRSVKTPLLTGSYSYDASTKDTYNGFFFVDTQGATPIPPYRKTLLLVFGETFPFSQYIPYMDKLFPDLGAFGRGSGPAVMPITLKSGTTVRLGPQICYEGLYPEFSAELARNGAQVFTNVTNDSWFGAQFEPKQHLIMTAARAIEFRRPLVRATNTGITTVILPSGRLLEMSPLLTEWFGSYQVSFMNNPPHTLYEKIVGLRSWALAIALVLLLGLARGKRNQSPQQS